MKLNKVKINNYKSISETEFPIDPNLTTLVGANEHGKTNVLRATQLLDGSTIIRDSDRRISKDPNTQDPKVTSVIYEFILEDEDIKEIEKMEEKANPEPPVESNKAKAINKSANPIKLGLEISYLDGSVNGYSVIASEFDEEEKKFLLELITSKLQDHIFYFDTFEDRLGHRIPKDEIINRKNDVTNGLIKLAGLQGKEQAIFDDTTTARQLLLNGSNQLTEQLKKLWIQGKEDNIEVRISVRNVNDQEAFLNVDIEDFNTYGDISTRSRGFLFFLAFILKFKEYHDGGLENFIFLIDEPGIFLHPRGQKDLLLYLEHLSQFNQLIYTTHSPFMINRLNNFRVRVVSKDKEKGTQIDVKPYTHNWKSLRASLGMLLADSFYYADNNLIVEGPSDRLYAITLLKIFHEYSDIKSDLNILSIIDSGGAENVPSMAKIVKSEDRPYINLVDSDKSGKKAKTILTKFTDQDKIKEVSDFKSDAQTLEDLLPRKYFGQAVNDYISELADEGVCNKPQKEFIPRAKGSVIEQLEKYIEESAIGIENPSKLNIARHFENRVSGLAIDNFNIKEFSDSRPLVEWISKTLGVSIDSI